MKILYVAHEGKLGGASKSMLTLAKSMAEKGHEVTVLMPFRCCELQEELDNLSKIEKVSVFYTWWQYPSRMGKISMAAFLGGYFYNCVAKIRLYCKFHKRQFDIVHSNSSVINIGGYLCRIVKAQHVWHFREFGEPDLGTKYILGKKKSMRYISSHVDRIIYISKALQQYYNQWLKASLGTVIYNGISREYLYCKKGEEYCRDGIVHFLISGAIQKGKGQECVIEAVQLLQKRGFSDFQVVIAGRNINQYQSVLENMIQKYQLGDKVQIIGFVSNMVEVRRNADIELVCSDREAFGRVTIEAMMASNPVIASDSGANPELIEDGKNGMLFSCGNSERLSICMEKCLKDHQKICEMGKNAYNFAKEKFLSDRNTDEIERLYLDLLKQRRI